MPTVFVTGANRGLGLEFARQYAAHGWSVFATCRSPDDAKDLHEVSGDVDVQGLDVSDLNAIASVKNVIGDRPIDLLINNAGIMGDTCGFGDTDSEAWEEVFRIYTLAPLKISEALVDNVAASSIKKIVALTSGMGSIAETGGGYMAYRSSKAALNMVMKNMSLELAGRGIAVAVFHPGWARTDMGGPGAAVDPVESVAGMRDLIDQLTLAQSGAFWGWDGKQFPW